MYSPVTNQVSPVTEYEKSPDVSDKDLPKLLWEIDEAVATRPDSDWPSLASSIAKKLGSEGLASRILRAIVVSSNTSLRLFALELLLALPPEMPECLNLLCWLSTDGNPAVAKAAAYALGKHARSDNKAWELIKELANSSSSHVRLTACFACAGTSRPSVITLLERLSCDPNPDVREAAAEAWKQLAGKFPDIVLNALRRLAESDTADSGCLLRSTAVKVLPELATLFPEEVLALLDRLAGDTESQVRADCALAWGRLSKDFPKQSWLAFTKLVQIEDNANWQERVDIAHGLAHLAETMPDEALSLIEILTEDENGAVRTATIKAWAVLAHSSPDRALDVLFDLAKSEKGHTAWEEWNEAMEPLLRLAQDFPHMALQLHQHLSSSKNSGVRAVTARLLVALSKSKDFSDMALYLLTRLAQAGEGIDKWRERQAAAQAVSDLAPHHRNVVLPMLRTLAVDWDPDVRDAAINSWIVLAREHPDIALPMLNEMADIRDNSKNWRERYAATCVLAEVAQQFPGETLRTLESLAADPDYDVQMAAVSAWDNLACVFPEFALSVFTSLVANDNYVLIQGNTPIANGLAKIARKQQSKVLPVLESLMQREDDSGQHLAAKIWEDLACWRTQEALDITAIWSDSQNEIQSEARLRVLGVAAFCGFPQALLLLKEQWQTGDEEKRANIVKVWGELRFIEEAASVWHLSEAAKDSDWAVRETAARTLGTRGWLKPETITELLKVLIDDDEFAVSFAASSVLDSLEITDELNARIMGRFARYEQGRIWNFLKYQIEPSKKRWRQNGGFILGAFPPGLPLFEEMLEDILPDILAEPESGESESRAISRTEVGKIAPFTRSYLTRIGKVILTMLNLIFNSIGLSVNISVVNNSQAKSTEGRRLKPRTLGVDRTELRQLLLELREMFDQQDSYYLSKLERLVQLVPKPPLFYLIFLSAKNLHERRIARIGYDLASLVEQVDIADLLKGGEETRLRKRLPYALDHLSKEFRRLNAPGSKAYAELLDWLHQALTLTSLPDIPLLLKQSPRRSKMVEHGESWRDLSRAALQQAVNPLRDLSPETTPEVRTFTLLECSLNLEKAARTISKEAREPYRTVLLQAVTNWRELIADEAKQVHGGALLEIKVPDQVNDGETVELSVEFANKGPSPARNLRIEFSGDGFSTKERKVHLDNVLLAGQSISRSIKGRTSKRPFTVLVTVRYDDLQRADKKFQNEFHVTTTKVKWKKIYNPFLPGLPLKPGKHDHLFFGRGDVFDYLREKLDDTKTQHVLVLYGRRRTGKTSVLLRLSKQLSATHIVVYLDIQATEILRNGAAQHLEYIANIISETVSTALPEQASFYKPTREEYEQNPSRYFQQVFLPGLLRALGERRLLLVFDEFQAFEDKINRKELDAGFLPFMRNWIQFSDRIDFIFAGSKMVEELDKSLWGVLFNLSTVYELELLKPAESRDLMVKPLEGVGGTYDEPALDRLDWFTGHHPYFIQQLCSEVVEELNRREQKIVNVAVVDAAAEELIDNAAPQLRFLWDELNEKQQAVAASIQKRLQEQPDQLHCHMDDVWEWMANINPNVPKDDFRRLVRDLSRRALITENDGNLRFVMGLLQDYLAQYVLVSETRGRIYKQW